MKTVGLVPLDDYYRAHPLEEMRQRAADFLARQFNFLAKTAAFAGSETRFCEVQRMR